MSLPDGKREGDTERDGFLSYAWEWHAFSHGVYLGFTTKPWRTPPMPQRPDVEAESHYYRGGYVIGTLGQVAMLGGMAVSGGEMMGVTDVLGWL